MSRTTISLKYEVTSEGLITAGIPASKLADSFSNMPQMGKLKALMWMATPCLGTMR